MIKNLKSDATPSRSQPEKRRKTPEQQPATPEAGQFHATPEASRAKAEAPTAAKQRATKADIVVGLLRHDQGATIAALCEATGWQAHSVRGFLSATVKKRLSLPLASDLTADGERRYGIAEAGVGS